MKISVALATYNGQKYLTSQLETLSSQIVHPFELVVCDDGSTDSTLKILEGFQARAPFPVSIHVNAHRLGYGDNFLKAASLCSGDLIAFCDQDDIWREHKLQVCAHEFFVNDDLHLLCHAATEFTFLPIGESPGIAKPFTVRRGEKSPLPWSAGCVTIVRREVISEILRRLPANHPGIAHDNGAFFVANEIGTLKYIPEKLILHRVHGNNVSNYRSRGRDRVRFAARVGAEQYRAQSAALANTAASLRAMGLERSAREHEKAAATAARRASAYSERNRAKRLAMIASSALQGHYSRSLGMNGLQSIAKDVAICVYSGRA